MKIYNTFHISLLEPAPVDTKTLELIYINKESQELYYKINDIIRSK